MFRPPPEYFWRCSKQKYEKQFRRKAPQWVLALDREFARRLFNTCCKIGLKLHPEVLTLAEEHGGSESVWSTKPCWRHDQLVKPPKKPVVIPKNHKG